MQAHEVDNSFHLRFEVHVSQRCASALMNSRLALCLIKFQPRIHPAFQKMFSIPVGFIDLSEQTAECKLYLVRCGLDRFLTQECPLIISYICDSSGYFCCSISEVFKSCVAIWSTNIMINYYSICVILCNEISYETWHKRSN